MVTRVLCHPRGKVARFCRIIGGTESKGGSHVVASVSCSSGISGRGPGFRGTGFGGLLFHPWAVRPTAGKRDSFTWRLQPWEAGRPGRRSRFRQTVERSAHHSRCISSAANWRHSFNIGRANPISNGYAKRVRPFANTLTKGVQRYKNYHRGERDAHTRQSGEVRFLDRPGYHAGSLPVFLLSGLDPHVS